MKEDKIFNIISNAPEDEYEVMDLCEYYNKILGISIRSDFSNEKSMIDKSVYKIS